MASVPDLITVLDAQSGSHLGTPECKFLSLMSQRTSMNTYILDRYIRTLCYSHRTRWASFMALGSRIEGWWTYCFWVCIKTSCQWGLMSDFWFSSLQSTTYVCASRRLPRTQIGYWRVWKYSELTNPLIIFDHQRQRTMRYNGASKHHINSPMPFDTRIVDRCIDAIARWYNLQNEKEWNVL